MTLNRRQLLTATTPIALSAVLFGCAKTPGGTGTGTVNLSVTLPGAQAEANSVLAAFQAAAKASTNPALAEALSIATVANAAFQGASATNFALDAQQVYNALVQLVPLVPLPPAAQVPLQIGLAFIGALIAGQVTMSAPASVVPTGAAPNAAPIPIPVS